MQKTSTPKGRLFIMMALEFFIWGAWLPLIFGYLPSLGFTPGQQSLILNAFPIASILGMFFGNQWADRRFRPERFLSFSHLLGGLTILGCGFTRDFWPFFLLMLVHCLFYVPTLSIVNSVAFANIRDPEKEFGVVRVGGTIGWILAAWPFTFIFVDWDAVAATPTTGLVAWLGTVLSHPLSGPAAIATTRWTFIVAGLASLTLSVFCLTLPRSAPRAVTGGTQEKLAWLEALRLLKKPFILVLWLVTLADSFVLNSYFNWTGIFLSRPVTEGGVGIAGNWIMPVMSLGQVAEILTMLVLGAALQKLGWRTTMIIGVLGHVARFAVYAYFPHSPGLIILIQLLHGICYAFFFATIYIFVDAIFPKHIRASAQGLFNLQILGLGTLLANTLCPWLLQNVYTENGITNFHDLFLMPLAVAAGAALILALFFHPPTSTTPAADTPAS